MIEAVRTGESRVLVVHGAPGIGKSALLEHAENSATGMRVLRAAGVESEIEVPFAALHQLCAPLLDELAGLPAPQRDAIETVFGMRTGTPPQRLLVGLAVLSLLLNASERCPLLCVVDDAQWLDRTSAQVLGFVARRLLAESVALIFGSRQRSQDLIGLPELEVIGLKDADAHALLDSVTHTRLDERVRDQVVAETGGNPLALVELPRGLSVTQLAGGFGLLHAGAIPALRKAMTALQECPAQELLKWGWAACLISRSLWDDRAMRETYARAVDVVRAGGALAELPIHLASLGIATVLTGEFAAAAATIAESDAVTTATGMPIAQHTELLLKAWQGKEAEASALIGTTIEWAAADGQLTGVTRAHWAAAVLNNGLARYEQALPAARAGAQAPQVLGAALVLPELIEAASRLGDAMTARSALKDLHDAIGPCDTDWAQGVLARSQALLADDAAAADGLYREAIERLSRTLIRPELARAHLLYGEWLRRDRQRVEARAHLRTAYEMFVSIGMEAFAERTRRELLATGETVRKRTSEASSSDELTPQERQIARLVRDGLSNPEVGAQLFLSPRTVEWHLRKIFIKLRISSRRELIRVLPRN